MDGDVAPLTELVELAESYGAYLYVDEAHAIGVLGDRGRGACADAGVAERVQVRLGTCGKSMGSSGAFVLGSSTLTDYLYNRARSFVYSTAPPPSALGATAEAISVLEEGEAQRELWRRIDAMANALAARGWWSGEPRSPIFPVHLGDELRAVSLSKSLDADGFFVQAIRPPTVPAGTARLRVTVRADLPLALIDRFAEALTEHASRQGIKPTPSSHG